MVRRWMRAAVVVALLFGVAACGGDDNKTTDTTKDGSTTGNGGNGGGSGGGSGADLAAILGAQGCVRIAAAIGGQVAMAYNPMMADPEALADARDFYDSLSSKIPDDIKADVELVAEWSGKVAKVYTDAGIKAGESDPAKYQAASPKLEALQEEYSDKLNTAMQHISTWSSQECPKLVGK